MNDLNKRSIKIYEDKIKHDGKGGILYHPFEKLFYWTKEKVPKNRNDLIFAGDDLYNSVLFSDICDFSIEFDGECDSERYREAWADSYRGKILRNIMKNEFSWYIGFRSLNPIQLVKDNNKFIIPECLNYYLNNKSKNQIRTLKSKKPYGYDGLGEVDRLFIEVSKNEIEWVVSQIWPDAMEVYSIEGYCFESGKIDWMEKWNNKTRNEHLFRDILNQVNMLFYTYPSEHRHFQFFTNKYNFPEFRAVSGIDNLDIRINS